MKGYIRAILVLTTCMACGAQAKAQDRPTVEQKSAFAAMTAPANLPLGAPLGSEVEKSRSAVELILEGTQDEGVGTAAIGWKRGSTLYRTKFSSPISKSTKEAVPFDLSEGLPNDATFEFTIANLLWAQPSDADLEAIEPLCQADVKRARCQIGELSPGSRAEARRLLRFDAMPKYIGVTVVGARREFSYLDSKFAKQSESQRNLSVTGRLGAFSQTFGFGFVSWTYQEQFRPGSDPQNICLPLEGTLGFTCDDVTLGAPTKKTSSIIGAELRHWFGGSVGMAPSIRRDLKADVTSASLPVYFLKNRDGALTGGLRANWRSDTDKLSFSVFVATAFGTVP